MYTVVILPLAKLDIYEAAAWYNARQTGLGRRFTREVRSKVQFIRKNPEASAIRYGNTFCAVLDVFPFMIHYNLDQAKKTIVIVAVFHTSLHPDKWQKR